MRKYLRSGCLTIATISLILILWIGFKVWRLYKLNLAFQEHLATVEVLLDAPDPLGDLNGDEVLTLITDVRTDMVLLKSEVEPYLFLTPYLTWLPKVGPLMIDAANYLELADAGTATLARMGSTIDLALNNSPSDAIADDKIELVLNLLQSAQPDLEGAEEDVARITEAYFNLQNREDIPAQIQPFLPLLDQYLPLAKEGVAVAQLLPALLGTNEEKTFLIWAQNADELRATGGYISGVGLMRVRNGEIVSLEFTNTDAVNSFDNLDLYSYPPEPMQMFMGLDYFLFRDANYWPDFPTSAEQGIELFNIGQPDAPQIDGVIAFDQYFVQMILNAIGPVYVPELERNVAAQTILTDIQAAWGTGDDTVDQVWLENRKRFIGEIAQAILGHLMTDPGEIDVSRLGDALLNATAQRHLLVYVQDADAQAILHELNWDGHFDGGSTTQDHLLTLDMNMGYNKSNAIVNRELRYEVNLSDGAAFSADLFIRYQHAGFATGEACIHAPALYAGGVSLSYSDLVNLCYFNFLRVYTPQGASLQDASRHTTPAGALLFDQVWSGSANAITDPKDANGFWNFFVLPQGELLTTHMQYALPPSIIQQNVDGSFSYRLTLYKQAGTLATPTQVTVQLPVGTILVNPLPDGATVDAGAITWQTQLDRDQTFEIRFHR